MVNLEWHPNTELMAKLYAEQWGMDYEVYGNPEQVYFDEFSLAPGDLFNALRLGLTPKDIKSWLAGCFLTKTYVPLLVFCGDGIMVKPGMHFNRIEMRDPEKTAYRHYRKIDVDTPPENKVDKEIRAIGW